MADPISIGLMAAGSLIGGIEEHGALKAGARADMENGRLATLQGELDAQQTRRDERLASGAALAGAAADGVALGTGTMADLIEQNAMERELEILNLQNHAAGERRNYEQAAADKRKAAKFALIKGVIGAGSAIAGGVADGKAKSRLSDAKARDRASAEGSPRRLAQASPTMGVVAGDGIPRRRDPLQFGFQRRRFGVLPGY